MPIYIHIYIDMYIYTHRLGHAGFLPSAAVHWSSFGASVPDVWFDDSLGLDVAGVQALRRLHRATDPRDLHESPGAFKSPKSKNAP